MSTAVKIGAGIVGGVVLLIILGVGCMAFIASSVDEPATQSSSGSEAPSPAQEKAEQSSEVDLVVNDVQEGYVSSNQFIQPDEGNEYLLVGMTITNGTSRDLSVMAPEFELRDASGVSRRAELTPPSEVSDALETVKLAPGASTSGKLIFQAPRGANELTVVFSPMGGRAVEAKVR